MPTIIINSIPIDFPDDGSSPDWAPAIIQFAQAVELVLSATANPYDVAPQSFTIDSYNSASNIDIPALSFPIGSVRAVFIRYSVYRSTNSTNAEEAGDMIAVYNTNNSSSHKWSLTLGNRTGKDGGASVTFNMTDAGQIQFSTTALSGSSHIGKITFDARALAQ